MKQLFVGYGSKLKSLFVEYGILAFVINYLIFGVVIAGFAFAISSGWDVSSGGEKAGLWFSAYVATKAVQPVRIAATLLITPVVAKYIPYFQKSRSAEPIASARAFSAPSTGADHSPDTDDGSNFLGTELGSMASPPIMATQSIASSKQI